jgi:hypothetical protein
MRAPVAPDSTSHVVDDEARKIKENRDMPHTAGMRFEVGVAFVSIINGRTAVVAKVRDEGRSGLLRFGDNGSTAWELCESGKWHEVDWTGWYVEHYEFAANRPDWTSSVRHFDAVTALIGQTAARRDHIRVQPPSKATEVQIDWIKAQPSATRI